MSRPTGPPRSMTRIARPAEVKRAIDNLIEVAQEVKRDYPAVYDLCYSGRTYKDTEPVTSGHGHSDPTGEVGVGDKHLEMRDDLRRISLKIGEATRALQSASTAIGKTTRKADFRHHRYTTDVPSDEVLSKAEHKRLQDRAARRRHEESA